MQRPRLSDPKAAWALTSRWDEGCELERAEHENGRGYVLIRRSDGQRLRWETLPRTEGLLSLNVVGGRFHADALRDASFAPGSTLKLQREPDNPHDAEAISVRNAAGTLTAGYIAHEDAAHLAPRLDAGETFTTVAMWEMLEAGQRVHLRILVIRELALSRGVRFRS